MAPIKKQSFNNVHPVKNYLVSLSISGVNELSFVGGGGGEGKGDLGERETEWGRYGDKLNMMSWLKIPVT